MKKRISPYDIVYDKEFVRVAMKACGDCAASEDLNRVIRVTPFEGAYGTAGYVIAVEGSPPRALLLLEMHAGPVLTVFRLRQVKRQHSWKPLTAAEQWLVDYLIAHIAKVEKTI